jgi:Na+/H+ antiporter NhaB
VQLLALGLAGQQVLAVWVVGWLAWRLMEVGVVGLEGWLVQQQRQVVVG